MITLVTHLITHLITDQIIDNIILLRLLRIKSRAYMRVNT